MAERLEMCGLNHYHYNDIHIRRYLKRYVYCSNLHHLLSGFPRVSSFLRSADGLNVNVVSLVDDISSSVGDITELVTSAVCKY